MSNKSRASLIARVLRSDRPKEIVSEDKRLVMDRHGNVRMNLDNPEVQHDIKTQVDAFRKMSAGLQQSEAH